MQIQTDTSLLSDPRRQAALLYWQGFSVKQIAEMLKQKAPTVQSWKQREKWDDIAPISRVESSIEARMVQLVLKTKKRAATTKKLTCWAARLSASRASAVT